MVYLFPFEGSNDKVKEAFKFFGDIKEVKHQQWSNVPGVYTGYAFGAHGAQARDPAEHQN